MFAPKEKRHCINQSIKDKIIWQGLWAETIGRRLFSKVGPDAKVVDEVEKWEKTNYEGIEVKTGRRSALLRDEDCHDRTRVEGQSITGEELGCKRY